MPRLAQRYWRQRRLGAVAAFGRADRLHDSPVVQRTLRLIEAVKKAGGFKALSVGHKCNADALRELDEHLR